MNIKCDISTKKRFVAGIKNGLSQTETTYANKAKPIDNSKHFVKMDNIANNVISQFESDVNFTVVKSFKRGSYTIVLIYDKINGILYSIMTTSKYKALMNRKKLNHTHFFDALIDFNDELDIERQQLVIDERLFDKDNSKIDEIKEKIKTFLDGIKPTEYLSIVANMNGFKLTGVEAVLTSEYLEKIDTDDWSEYIEIDYSDISYDEAYMSSDFYDLEISLKVDIAEKNDVLEELITSKSEVKENKS